ncbi:luciferin 4-monooxygenase-like [Leguminivora glycinivorella]|uniref:luciferin 4-monooxygenase-like n=1 Tax=Leguminivora glycinivorella TaxID=1035111 RepID=UPI0020101AC3|nr:luciferin 4-monooxygenase-like [Leguminivora glycinivorella]
MLIHGEGEILLPEYLHFGKWILDRLRGTDPERACLISCTTGSIMTYKEVSQYAVRLAVALTQRGVGRGDTVVVAGEPPLVFLPTRLAVLLTGATLTLIETGCGEATFKHKLNLTRPSYIICTQRILNIYGAVLKRSDFIKTFICFDDVEGIESVDTLVSSEDVDVDQFEPSAVEQTDVAMVSFSSGTTGMSKGVLLTHLNLITRTQASTQWYFDYNSSHSEPLRVGYAAEPDCTSFYDVKMMLTLICSGQTVVYSDTDVDLKYVNEFRVHMMPTVPAIAEMLINSEDDLSSLKFVCIAGSTLNRRTAKLLQERCPDIKLVLLYGTTESGSIATTQNKAFDYDVVNEDPRAEGYCVGYAVPGVTVKIVDVETREILGPNQRGELCVRGPRLMKGYLGATEPYLDQQEYYLTGDLGYFDDQKRIYLVNRLKDVINYMGEKISPGDVEAVLQQHPAVQEAAVVGKPTEVEGEELPTAFVVIRSGATATETELVDYVASQVTKYMQLRGGVRFVPELPRSVMQKVLRRRLKEMLAHE